MGAEDFAFLSAERPGAFILLGNGDSAELHNPGYDFDDKDAGYAFSAPCNADANGPSAQTTTRQATVVAS